MNEEISRLDSEIDRKLGLEKEKSKVRRAIEKFSGTMLILSLLYAACSYAKIVCTFIVSIISDTFKNTVKAYDLYLYFRDPAFYYDGLELYLWFILCILMVWALYMVINGVIRFYINDFIPERYYSLSKILTLIVIGVIIWFSIG